MARTKKTTEEQVNEFHNQLDSFLQKSLGMEIQSLKDGGVIPYWLDTGCLALNWIISNDFFKGIPGTRVILIVGDPGKGKSFVLDAILGSNIRQGGVSYKADIENSANFEFTTQIVGNDIAEQIRLIKPKEGNVISIERLTDIVNKMIDFQASTKEANRKQIVLGIDSITQLTSAKEIDIVSKRKEGKKDKQDMTSAKKMRELLRSNEQKFPFANMTLIGIAQLTANITTGFTPPGTPTKVPNTKGSGPGFASSLNLVVMSDKEILHAKTGIPIGIKMRIKTTKNRIKFKGRDCRLHFYFAKGIDRLGGLCELLARYGVFKPSKAAAKNGEYLPSTVFTYTADSGTDFEFTEAKFPTIINTVGDDFLRELNVKLNNIYERILADEGVTDEDLYVEDQDYDDTEEAGEEDDD